MYNTAEKYHEAYAHSFTHSDPIYTQSPNELPSFNFEHDPYAKVSI